MPKPNKSWNYGQVKHYIGTHKLNKGPNKIKKTEKFPVMIEKLKASGHWEGSKTKMKKITPSKIKMSYKVPWEGKGISGPKKMKKEDEVRPVSKKIAPLKNPLKPRPPKPPTPPLPPREPKKAAPKKVEPKKAAPKKAVPEKHPWKGGLKPNIEWSANKLKTYLGKHGLTTKKIAGENKIPKGDIKSKSSSYGHDSIWTHSSSVIDRLKALDQWEEKTREQEIEERDEWMRQQKIKEAQDRRDREESDAKSRVKERAIRAREAHAQFMRGGYSQGETLRSTVGIRRR